MNKKNYILKNGVILTPFKTICGHNLLIENGKIKNILNSYISIYEEEKYEVIDLKGKYYITPGLIDIHTHGGGGEDCVGGDFETISRYKLKEGITGYLPTFIASPLELIFNSFKNIEEFRNSEKSQKLPKILGVHIEGIYLSQKYKGAQRLDFLRNPDVSECLKIIKRSNNLLKIMTLAPELNNCMEIVELLSNYGIISSIGHSNATNDEVDRAIDKGLSHVTHAFNAMGEMFSPEPGVRHPGLEGYVLVKDELKLEIIGELTHVNANIMEIVYRTKGVDKIILVTDSLSVSGFPAGKYNIGVMTLIISEDNPSVARLKNGELAGSVVPLIEAVKNFYESTSASLNEVIQLATFNPAQSLGILNKKGSIEIGKDADLIIFDKNFKIQKVFIEGDAIFEV